MIRSSWFSTYDIIVTWVIGVAFLLAGVPHWGNPYYFLGSVYTYKLVDPDVGQMVAISLRERFSFSGFLCGEIFSCSLIIPKVFPSICFIETP
ncbi:MAG: hypothetical protein LBG58_06560 [Planctomycetaceae bacterium]|jgi:hypothetical protein|nr:hypothetical protein [Planctomycetaceae bacterium]